MTRLYLIGAGNEDDITFKELSGFEGVTSVGYWELFSGKGIIATGAPVMLTFPYVLWDRLVETGKGLYGTAEFGCRIRNLAENITGVLEDRLPRATYVNHPMTMLLERDKKRAKQIVQEAGLQVTEDLPKDARAVLDSVRNGRPVYIKVRYGSMGKGISYFGFDRDGRDRWTTNFMYDGGVIKNHPGDHDWTEIDITGDTGFLEQILREDVIVEKAVLNPKVDGTKFDMRAVLMYGDLDPDNSCGRMVRGRSITNVSQGATELTLDDFGQYVPPEQIGLAADLIRKAAEALGLRYAGGDVLFEGEQYAPVFLEINSFPGPPTRNIRESFTKLYKAILDNTGR
ncbi:hypothetical protein KY362_08025 [Candidatus Woesearchaeota archaeon]|nr:hypothetical protein [Candidatus Woesearchaeota archaeon]